ncbi:TetR/AcrR family transcriptional regulator [Paenibacillus sp. URB8-2]|uniref:TetR/AcrR family transcriptional regulator n=1 Tax=Paenibacillus sp. URB8-2 TaxID=2741301 RepID=UPI0015C25846|nr:TetR/AcrR family transcriptional regulator [Paenibacillus sp. URB8-2]BCG57560.1 AcrR family transcriptional regulator [Paenibacillus sp. URB8-2]
MNETEEQIADKTRTPRQDRSIKTKDAIVQAAAKLFSEKGYHRTNTKQIAAAARVSTGSFYSYFTDKRDVFLDVLKIHSEAMQAHVDSTVAQLGTHPSDKRVIISHMIDSLIQSHAPYISFHRELSLLQLSDEVIKEVMESQYDLGRRKTLEFLKLSEHELRASDLEAAAVVVFESVSSVVDRIVFSGGGISANRIKAELVDMLVHYLFGE